MQLNEEKPAEPQQGPIRTRYPSVDSAWKAFRKETLPKNASKRQVHEARAAFHCGALIMYRSVMEPASEQADVEYMANLEKEFAEFGMRLDEQ